MLRNAVATAMPAATLFPLTFSKFKFFSFFSSKPPGRKQKQKWKTPRKNSNRKRGFVGTLFIYRFRKPGKPGKAGEKQKKANRERNAVSQSDPSNPVNENQTPPEAPDPLDRDRIIGLDPYLTVVDRETS